MRAAQRIHQPGAKAVLKGGGMAGNLRVSMFGLMVTTWKP